MSQAMEDLRATVARLRGPGGCPWDQEQTHLSLCDCLVEECAELLDTLDRGDFPHMREELGDLLLQVVMHARMAEEAGHFDLEEVAREINEKLVRRHPHVFGDKRLSDSEAVLEQWEKIKAEEKKNGPAEDDGPFKHLPPRLPALLYARDIYKRIQKAKLPVDGAFNETAITTMSDSLTEAEAGRRLWEITAACRRVGIDPESALRREADRIRERITRHVTEQAKFTEADRG